MLLERRTLATRMRTLLSEEEKPSPDYGGKPMEGSGLI